MNALYAQILERFKFLLSQKNSKFKITLFGSRAIGDSEPVSDMDVLVVVNELTPENRDYISECAWEAGFSQGIVVVPIVYTREEWEEGPEQYSLLAQAVQQDGIKM